MYKSNLKAVKKQMSLAQKVALTSIGEYAEGQAKLLAPVDTGNLRGSISHEVNKDHVVIGSNVEYSPFVEKGSSKQKAQPFLSPSVEGNIKTINQLAEKVYKSKMRG